MYIISNFYLILRYKFISYTEYVFKLFSFCLFHSLCVLFVIVEDDNWYSSDEEDQKDSKKLTDVLKNINRQVSTNDASYLEGILQVLKGSS